MEADLKTSLYLWVLYRLFCLLIEVGQVIGNVWKLHSSILFTVCENPTRIFGFMVSVFFNNYNSSKLYNLFSSVITNKCTFCIYVTLLPYICFGCGTDIIRGTLVGSPHWHWFIWYCHTSSQCFCSLCSLSNAGCVRLTSRARGITVMKQYLFGSS